MADYSVLFTLTEIFHVWYVISTACGALSGAITNFILNRHWTFHATDGNLSGQAIRYTLVATGSLLLNTSGVYLLTEGTRIHYAFSVIFVGLTVATVYNYPLQRFFVYRK